MKTFHPHVQVGRDHFPFPGWTTTVGLFTLSSEHRTPQSSRPPLEKQKSVIYWSHLSGAQSLLRDLHSAERGERRERGERERREITPVRPTSICQSRVDGRSGSGMQKGRY